HYGTVSRPLGCHAHDRRSGFLRYANRSALVGHASPGNQTLFEHACRLVSGIEIDGRHRDVEEPRVEARLGPVVDQMVESPNANHARPRRTKGTAYISLAGQCLIVRTYMQTGHGSHRSSNSSRKCIKRTPAGQYFIEPGTIVKEGVCAGQFG